MTATIVDILLIVATLTACAHSRHEKANAVQETSAVPSPENTDENTDESTNKPIIRQILLEELKLDARPPHARLALLQDLVSGDRAAFLVKSGGRSDLGEQRLFAAIELAVYGDPSGADTLLHPHDYFITNSEFEIPYAFAALVLIDRNPAGVWVWFNVVSDRLESALTPYVQTARPRSPQNRWPGTSS
jgi:hypothetical protein